MANTTHTQFFHPFARFGAVIFGRQTPILGAQTHPGIFKSLLASFNAWRARRAAAAELARLSDRDLADIGVTRQQIPEVVAKGGR